MDTNEKRFNGPSGSNGLRDQHGGQAAFDALVPTGEEDTRRGERLVHEQNLATCPTTPRHRGGENLALGPQISAFNEAEHLGELPFDCDICGRTFGTKTGRGVHRRRAHPTRYHQGETQVLRKRRWTDEERRVVARADVVLTLRIRRRCPNGYDSVVLDNLADRFAVDRTRNALAAVRRKPSYHALYSEEASLLLQEEARDEARAMESGQETDQPEWRSRIRDALRQQRTGAHRCIDS